MAAELAGSKDILDFIVFVGAVMLPAGGAWCGVLGFFLLDWVGWRVLILLTSLPVFIPSIFIIHFAFTGESERRAQESDDIHELEDEDMTTLDFTLRVVKLGLFSAISTFQGWGTILLVPTMIQLLKIKEAGQNPDCQVTVTQGVELLLLALVTSAAIPGRMFVHFTRNKLSFRLVQFGVALLNVVCFTIMLIQNSVAGIVVTNLIVKLLFGASIMTARSFSFDVRYLGVSRFALGSGIICSSMLVGGVVGTAMVAFRSVLAVMITSLVLSVFQSFLVLSMKEIQKLSTM